MFYLLVILYMSIQVERGICNIGLRESWLRYTRHSNGSDCNSTGS